MSELKRELNLKRLHNHYTQLKKIRNRDGITILEVVLAIGILAFGLLGTAKMQMMAISGSGLADRATIGSNLAQDQIEYLMAMGYSAFFTDPELLEGRHAASNPPKGYGITWTVTDDTPVIGSKHIAVTVTWKLKGVQKETTLNVIKAKW